jgi:hypothetical protein
MHTKQRHHENKSMLMPSLLPMNNKKPENLSSSLLVHNEKIKIEIGVSNAKVQYQVSIHQFFTLEKQFIVTFLKSKSQSNNLAEGNFFSVLFLHFVVMMINVLL